MYPIGTTLKVDFPTYSHYGIADGVGYVIHNSKRRLKVTREPESVFASGRDIQVSGIAGKNPARAVHKAKTLIGKQYSLTRDNCEHFVRGVHGLKPECIQLQKYVLGALGVGVAMGSGNPALRAAGLGAAAGSLLTPAEKSPHKNAAIGALLAALVGAAFKVIRRPKHEE